MSNAKRKFILVVLDGFGVASSAPGNAITRADMKTFNRLVNSYPSLTLQAAGPNVGLAWGEPGNSEVGHMCLGAGRIVLQDMPRIDRTITSGEFYKNEAFLGAIEHAKKNGSALHLIGLVGNGNVHASQLHLYSLLIMAATAGLKKVYIHAITDGRDTAPDDARAAIRDLEKKMIEVGCGRIATLIGRFFAMDRAQHWDLTELAYKAMVAGQGEIAANPRAALEQYYAGSVYDETIPPTLIVPPGEQPAVIAPSDAIILFNFRADRAIQITQALCDPTRLQFSQFYRKQENLYVATMTEYLKGLPVAVAYPRLKVANTLSEVLSSNKMRQLHISETEKYPHVTYFFGNGREETLPLEEWDKVSSNASYQDRYQNVPQMSAAELTDKVLKKMEEDYSFYLINYANPDMVGHTGNLGAAIKAVQAIDKCLEKLAAAVEMRGDTILMITADHGNTEEVHEIMTGRIHKSHTTNPVPFVVVGKDFALAHPRKSGYLYLATQIPEGLLSDVAPTILDIWGMEKPAGMTGISLASVLSRQLKE